MKKTILPPAILLFGLCTAQVGINTANPKATFHIDGGKDNPINNDTPTIGQQANDFVVTSNGNVGVATIAPTEKLEVNGKTKINDLPLNGTAGFIATKTLVASDTGVVGVLNGLPSKAYQLTSLKGFSTNNSSPRFYGYQQLVSNNCYDNVGNASPGSSVCNVPTSTVFNENYTFSFDKSSNNTEKYIQMNIDYLARFDSKNSIVVRSGFFFYYVLEVTINDIIVKAFTEHSSIAANGNGLFYNSKALTVDLSGINLNPTNNVVKIYYKILGTSIKSNAGNLDGNFETNAPIVMRTGIVDVSFQLYEK